MKNVKYLLTLGGVILLCMMTTISAQASSDDSAQNKASVRFKIVDTEDSVEEAEGGGTDNSNNESSNGGNNQQNNNGDNSNNDSSGNTGNNDGKFPQTGESFQFSVMVSLLLISGMGLILLVWRRRTEVADKTIQIREY